MAKPFDTMRIRVLATYNSEKARGIVHTDEWKELMKQEQKWFDNRNKPSETNDATRPT